MMNMGRAVLQTLEFSQELTLVLAVFHSALRRKVNGRIYPELKSKLHVVEV